MPEEAAHAPAVGDAPRAAGELERAPVVEEQPDQAQPGERAEHEPRGQPQHLREPVGEVGRVDRDEQHDRRAGAIASTRKKRRERRASSEPSLTRTKNHST